MLEWLLKYEKFLNMKEIEEEIGAPIEKYKLKQLLKKMEREIPLDEDN